MTQTQTTEFDNEMKALAQGVYKGNQKSIPKEYYPVGEYIDIRIFLFFVVIIQKYKILYKIIRMIFTNYSDFSFMYFKRFNPLLNGYHF